MKPKLGSNHSYVGPGSYRGLTFRIIFIDEENDGDIYAHCIHACWRGDAALFAKHFHAA